MDKGNNVETQKNVSGIPILSVPEDAQKLSQSSIYKYFVDCFKGDADHHYPYCNLQGETLGYILRWNAVGQKNGNGSGHGNGGNKKEIRPFIYGQFPDGSKKWCAQGFPFPRPLFNLDKLAQHHEKPVLICEGEKTALAAEILFPNFVTTTTMQGAQSAKKTDYSPLKNRHVIIAMDNDEAGLKYGKDVYEQCHDAGVSSIQFLSNDVFSHCNIQDGAVVKQNQLTILAKGYDLADALGDGWTAELLSRFVHTPDSDMPLFVHYEHVFSDSVQVDTDTKVLKGLAELSALEYDRLRKDEAKRLGISLSTLDQEVKKHRRSELADNGKEAADIFPTIDPWPDSVIADDLLQDITQLLKRFAILPLYADTAIVLWVIFTWVIDQVSVSPILAVSSPEKRCGKTTVISLLGQLVCKPLLASNISAAGLFRTIELWQPTMIIDEADTFIRDSDELRGMINSGHTRPTAYVIRTIGEDHTPKRFSTWGAKAIAIIGNLPDTLHDRSIVISLRRKLVHEKTEKLRYADPQIFTTLQRKLLRFAQDNAEIIRTTRLVFPNDLTISDRALDNWEPLLVIAKLAGSIWMDKALQAASHLSNNDKEALPIGTELLSDIEKVFEEKSLFKIHTVDLINYLCEDEESPWGMYNFRGQDKRITPRQLSKLLTPYRIHSRNIEIVGIQRKGFDKHTFTEAWERYNILSSSPS